MATSNVGEIYSSEIIKHPTSGFGALVVGTEYGPRLLQQNIINNISSSTTAPSILWNKLGTKVPNVQINDMDYNAADDILVIGTLGRGAWSIRGFYSTPSNLSPIMSLTLSLTTGTHHTQQLIGTQEIPLENIQLGSNSVPITEPSMIAAFNSNPAGTIFAPSLIATYNPGSFPSGDTLSIPSVSNFIPRPITQ